MTVIAAIRRTKVREGIRSTLAGAALAGLCACGGGDPETGAVERANEQAAAARAASVQRTVTKDKFAYANYVESTNNCESVSVEVFASKGSVRSDGTSSEQSQLRAQLITTNFCTGTSGFLSGEAVPDVIRFRNDLAQAAATATVVLHDLMGTTMTLRMDLVWAGGELTTDKMKHVTVTPVSRTVITTVDEIRRSETISGTLVLDGVDLLAANRPVQSRSTTGFVTASKGVTIEIMREP
jgi:hypothetical protein